MDGVDEFLELIEWGGCAVKFSEGRIDIHEVESGEGTAVLAHTRIGGGCGMNGKKLDDVAAEMADYEVELLNEVAKCTGGGEYGVVCFGELINSGLVLWLYGILIAGGAEEADKGGINGIIGDGFSGFNFYDGITSLGPVEGFIGGTEICFGFIPSDMVEGEREFPGAIWIFLHGDVMPVAV